jgi:hypothetical protein
MNPKQLLTLKTPVALRLMRQFPGRAGGPEPFNVNVTHIVGRCRSAAEDGKRAIYTVEEVAWDKDSPQFYPLGLEYGLTGTDGPHAEVDLRVDNVKSFQKLAK